MADRPQVTTISAPSNEETLANAQANIAGLSSSVVTADIQGGRRYTGAFLRDLDTDGWAQANPTQAAALKEYSQQPQNRVTPKMLAELRTLGDRQKRLQGFLETGIGPKGQPLTNAQRKEYERRLRNTTATLERKTANVDARTQRVEAYTAQLKGEAPKTAASIMRDADPETYANIDRAQGIADTIGQVTPEGQAFLDAAGRGYTAGTISAQNVNAAQMGPIGNVSAQQVTAPTMGDFGRANATRISAGQVGTGTLGQSLMQRALSGIASGGRLNEQASRDAIQSARQAFAARGLATGGAAIGAELLNRDRYARQREMEDLQFASGVQGQDLGRQFQNVGNQLAADQSNQQAALQAELANLQARYNAAVQQGDWQQAAAIANQSATLEADKANQTTAFNVGQANMSELNRVNMFNSENALRAAGMQEDANRMGTVTNNEMLYNAAGYQDSLKAQGLGASIQMAGIQQANNPLFRALNLNPYAGGPGSAAMTTGAQMADNAANRTMAADEFNANANMWSNSFKFMPSFNSGGSITGSAFGDFALNTAVNVGTELGGAALARSDRRLKENIKPLGSAAGILGLKAYKFDYKDGKKNVVGLMAQDVRRVLPEAVKTITVDGKKRLAIKPQVIGAALARELSRAAA
jgi:hypothetical protein